MRGQEDCVNETDTLNSLDDDAGYTQVAELLTDYHTPIEGGDT